MIKQPHSMEMTRGARGKVSMSRKKNHATQSVRVILLMKIHAYILLMNDALTPSKNMLPRALPWRISTRQTIHGKMIRTAFHVPVMSIIAPSCHVIVMATCSDVNEDEKVKRSSLVLGGLARPRLFISKLQAQHIRCLTSYLVVGLGVPFVLIVCESQHVFVVAYVCDAARTVNGLIVRFARVVLKIGQLRPVRASADELRRDLRTRRKTARVNLASRPVRVYFGPWPTGFYWGSRLVWVNLVWPGCVNSVRSVWVGLGSSSKWVTLDSGPVRSRSDDGRRCGRREVIRRGVRRFGGSYRPTLLREGSERFFEWFRFFRLSRDFGGPKRYARTLSASGFVQDIVCLRSPASVGGYSSCVVQSCFGPSYQEIVTRPFPRWRFIGVIVEWIVSDM